MKCIKYELLKGSSSDLFEDCVEDVSGRCDDGEIWGSQAAYLYIFYNLAFTFSSFLRNIPILAFQPPESTLIKWGKGPRMDQSGVKMENARKGMSRRVHENGSL